MIGEAASLGSGEVRLRAESVELDGMLALPREGRALVVFVHGSGSSRLSPRNRHVASALQEHGLGTLLFDLLTPEEERIDRSTAALRFDIDLLADRVDAVLAILSTDARTRALRVGLFGASTGAAAALVAAARRPDDVHAIVSRGGRPDLAGLLLARVRAPTLLIVGERDPDVVALNRKALAALGAPVRDLAVVPGATHLFEEAGTLDQVVALTATWFRRHLGPTATSGAHGS